MKSRPHLPCLLAALCATSLSASDVVPLSTLDLARMTAGWGKPQADKAITGKPLTIAGQTFAHGVGTHAKSLLWINLAGGSERFQASVGVDDAADNATASIEFKVAGDGTLLWRSGPMKLGDTARPVDIDVHGIRSLVLVVGDLGNGVSYDHADWAGAQFVVSSAKPVAATPPPEERVILTPKPGHAPRINGPDLVGARPGHPFLYRIPTTGERPMKFSAPGLPSGIVLDAGKGILSGQTPAKGEYRLTLKAANSHGSGKRVLKLVSGDTLALTPTMGWNHWYAHYNRITDAMAREAADHMVQSGMADVGYQYVSLDDCWMNAPKESDPKRVGPLRDAQGNILPNAHFPDMKALTDHIHGYGLKAGIYTSPGPFTCGGYAGAYEHEAQDARQFADWGFDLLKYDWCSYGDVVKGDSSLPTLKKPYQQMGDLLRAQSRDIVLNLCQYGMGKVWEWGASVGGHSWRTAGDLGFELDRIFEVALANAEHREFNRPGAWNDPDYVQIGYVGAANGMGEPRPCPLTPNEQYAFMSLWSLMASPLFFSGDITRLDEFTLNVLCNPEVIAVNQDPLGQCARVLPGNEDTFVMIKELADGSRAVGLFNRGEFATEVSVRWSDLGLPGKLRVRDLWRQKDLGRFAGSFVGTVPRHGGLLVRVGKR